MQIGFGKHTSNKTINCILISIIVILMGALLCLYRQAVKLDRLERNRMGRVRREAQPYERKLSKLKEDMIDQAENIDYTSDSTKLVVGFVLNDDKDIEFIEAIAEEYNFIPSIVFDASMSDDRLKEAAASLKNKELDYMVTMSPFSDRVTQATEILDDAFKNTKMKASKSFLLRSSDYSTKSIKLLKDAGYVGYTVYTYSLEKGAVVDDMCTFEYSFISFDNTDISDRIKLQVYNRAPMILSFDLNRMSTGALTEDGIRMILHQVDYFRTYNDIDMVSASDVCDEVFEGNRQEIQRQKEYESMVKERQALINEYRTQLNLIYSKWNDENF